MAPTAAQSQAPRPVTRNLTAAFARRRWERRRSRGAGPLGDLFGRGAGEWDADHHHLLACEEGFSVPASKPVAIEMAAVALPPAWVDTVESAGECLEDLKQKLVQLRKAHQRRLQRVFGDQAVASAEQEVHALTSDLRSALHRSEALVHQVGRAPDDLAEGEAAKAAELRRNAQRALAARLQSLSLAFRQAQQDYLREVKRRQLGGGVWDDTTSTASGGSHPASDFAAEAWEASQQAVMEEMELDAQQRTQEITRICTSIHDLHSIFREMAVLTIEQGSVLDRIDYNIEHVLANSEGANRQLQKAVKPGKSQRSLRCILTLAAIDLALLAILVVKTRA